ELFDNLATPIPESANEIVSASQLLSMNFLPPFAFESDGVSQVDVASVTDIPSSDISISPSINMPESDLSKIAVPGEQSKIEIIAQPNEMYHPRYMTDVDKDKNRALRYIRSSDRTHEYPTIKIPRMYLSDQYHIRVALVTVPNPTVPVRCVHPYRLEVPENESDVRHDANTNALYFPITSEDIDANGVKRFCRLLLIKTLQSNLKQCDRLRLFDQDVDDIQRVSTPNSPKDLIRNYKLYKSALVFTIAQLGVDEIVILNSTSAYSQTMIEEKERKKEQIRANVCSKCRSSDLPLTTMSSSPAKRAYMEHYDQTDSYSNESVPRSLVQPSLILPYIPAQHKQRQSNVPQTSTENFVETFLLKLQNDLANLIIDNDTGPLIHRTRKLVNIYPDNLLHCAIENGHTLLAQQVAKEVATLPNSIIERKNDRGETAILLAAKENRIDVLKTLLSIRIDLINALDNENDNIFHLLMPQSTSNETTEFLLNYLNRQLVNIKEKFDRRNTAGFTPLQLAVKNNNLDKTKMLIEIGQFNVDIIDQTNGDNLIHLAVRTNNLPLVKYFIDTEILNGLSTNFTMTPHELSKSLNRQAIYDFLEEKYVLDRQVPSTNSKSTSDQNEEVA
ncbi:unnamed protein product, partial [Didymodactylos carnosus]